jgi:hypothetical protein
MRRPITIAIAVTMLSLFALTFWQMGMDVTAEDAAVAAAPPKPEYTVTSNPYLPIQWLEPVW